MLTNKKILIVTSPNKDITLAAPADDGSWCTSL